MSDNPTTWKNEKLLGELKRAGVRPSAELVSIVLVGGKGTRLARERKLIRQSDYPELDPKYWGMEGSKGLAVMEVRTSAGPVRKPITDWHLDVHVHSRRMARATLALGVSSEVIIDYYRKRYSSCYRNLPLDFLVEERPAGTLAPIVKLYQEGRLPDRPLVYANGDNLMDIDLYGCYLSGCLQAARLGMQIEETVIDVVSLVPWEESFAYGTVDVDFDTGRVRGFREKAPIEDNVRVNLSGQEMTPINSGFSIIPNPAKLFSAFLSEEIVRTSERLEQGLLEYKLYESVVKYETLYGRVAQAGKMVAVYLPTFWTDLGTDEKIEAAEKAFGTTAVAVADRG